MECLSEWKDDDHPEFGPFDMGEHKEGMVFWDLHLSNYSNDFLAALVQGKGQWRIKILRSRPRGCGVHTGSSSSTGQGRVSEGQAADTHTSWIQLHGAGVCPSLTALGGNLLCMSEDKRGKAALAHQAEAVL